MLHYDRICLSESIDPAKSNKSKKCISYQCWYFIHRFKFRNFACNSHDLTMC